MLRISSSPSPSGMSKAQCFCVTIQISIMTNSVPEATKQLPTPLSVVTLATTSQSAIKKKNKQNNNTEEKPPRSHNTSTSLIHPLRSPTGNDSSSQGYLPSVLVDRSAMRRVDAVAVSVDPLDQPMVAGPSDGVQPRWEAALRKRHHTHYAAVSTGQQVIGTLSKK